ncbi:MAG: hypothetical protein ACYS9X_16970 [Planctomycetota bacterium]|jgi:hypothetical protein
MRRRSFLKAAGVAPAFLLAACQGKKSSGTRSSSTSEPETTADAGAAGKVLLCAKCGQIKGSDECCKEGAARCPKCGLAKGSPGCCRLGEAKADVTLCTSCGEVKGSEKCCKADAEKCGMCGLNKGSPGCCRIKPEKK